MGRREDVSKQLILFPYVHKCVCCLSRNLIKLLLIVLIICSRGNVCDDRSNDENEESDKALSSVYSESLQRAFCGSIQGKARAMPTTPSADDFLVFGDNANKLNAVGQGGNRNVFHLSHSKLSSAFLPTFMIDLFFC